LIREFSGLNEGVDPTAIGDNEFERLQNMYPFNGRLVRRSGLTKVTQSSAWDENINSMFAYKSAAGTWRLVTGGATKLGYLDGNTITDMAALSGAFTSSARAFRFAQYKDIAYFGRKVSGTLYRCDGAVQGAAGISAPSTAAVFAEGAAGDLGAGDYIGVVTFYNTSTGSESNPSDPSNTLTLAASKKITWSSIPVSTNAQIDARRLYRTLVDQAGEYYLVTTLTDNFTTTFTDNVVQSDMGDQASFDNGSPPAVCAHLAVWNDRLWITDETDLFFSELGLPESFSEYSVILVSPDDGHTLNGLLAFGDILLAGKTNATYMVVGADETDFGLSTLSDRFGVVSHDSMKTAEGLAFWFGGENYYLTDGNQVKAIGDKNIRNLVDGIDPDYYQLVTGGIVDSLGWYVTGIPAAGASTVDTYLIYNYRSDEWTHFTYDGDTPIVLGDFFTSNGTSIVYCSCSDGHVYTWNTGNTDDGTAIAVDILTKRFGIDKDDILKIMRDVALHTNKIAQTITVDIHADGTSRKSSSINLYDDKPWKGLSLSNKGYPGVYVQLRIQYSGFDSLEIKGYQMKVVDLNRRARKLG
jgi:hypothetical protein